jgi:hypothetical protein
MSVTIIDVWNPHTFDPALLTELEAQEGLIRNYFDTDRAQYIEYEKSDHTAPRPSNPYAEAFIRFHERLMHELGSRRIRAWHYTRLTDTEVSALKAGGIVLTSEALLRRRLDAQVSAGVFDAATADRLFSDSPIHSDQRHARDGKFWMVSHPFDPQHPGVTLLLEHWGGELVYFWQRDPHLIERLRGIGRARIIEVAVPLSCTKHTYSAAKAILASYGRQLRCHTEVGDFDLYANAELPPEAVLNVISEGDKCYSAVGTTYPLHFRSVRQSSD